MADLRDENGQPYYVIPSHVTGFDNEEYNALIEKAYATVSASERATVLHEAEAMLMQNLPVIPIVFNQSATLTSKELSAVETTYYGTANFSDTKLRNYENYLPTEE